MINFDSQTIYERALDRLQQQPDWKVISNNSVVTALLKSNSESMSEIGRYCEFLFKESRWNTASNPSSIMAMSNMFGYQPKRKISAIGELYVSIDPRIHLVGRGSDGIALDDFKSLTRDNPKIGNSSWIVPSNDWHITPGCTLTDSYGNYYVASYSTLKQGEPYCKVSIMEGRRKTTFIDIDTIRDTCTQSKIDQYLYIPIKITNCEDGNTSLVSDSNNVLSSKSYFKVYLVFDNDGDPEYSEYRVVSSYLLSTYSDRDVEVYNDLYSQDLFYLKFNNDVSRGSTLNISRNSNLLGIRIDYVETKGESGNLTSRFNTFTIADAVEFTSEGTVSKTTPLYGINLEPILGGAEAEDINDIKENAPKYYISNYTAGTRESYEKTIDNMSFTVKDSKGDINLPITPYNSRVYGGQELSEVGNLVPITNVTFISNGLSDISKSERSSYATAIQKKLTTYLDKIKSPQDNLRFVFPNYVSFAIGLDCTIPTTTTGEDVSTEEIESGIREMIDTSWGQDSQELDFAGTNGRSFTPSVDIITPIVNTWGVKPSDPEIEAICKLDWGTATRMDPRKDESEESEDLARIRTCRLNFAFDKLFLGNQYFKGFKDYRVGASYNMRVDFMYKKPIAMSISTPISTSLFIGENTKDKDSSEQGTVAYRTSTSFYAKVDNTSSSETTSNKGIWSDDTGKTITGDILKNSSYAELGSADAIDNTYQYRFKNKVYTDQAFNSLVSNEGGNLLTSYETDLGTISKFLIYFSGNYDDINDDNEIAPGWIEFPFDSIYKTLTVFSLYDANLRNELIDCKLSTLKCGNTSGAKEPFELFKKICKKYIDIYVSMRPIDTKLTSEEGNTILYIDSSDVDIELTTSSNITAEKKPRMISVNCN